MTTLSTQEIAPGLVLQNVSPNLKLSNFKLIAFDMDSTLINIECVDEIADAVGRKAEVAAITEASMRGEITVARVGWFHLLCRPRTGTLGD